MTPHYNTRTELLIIFMYNYSSTILLVIWYLIADMEFSDGVLFSIVNDNIYESEILKVQSSLLSLLIMHGCAVKYLNPPHTLTHTLTHTELTISSHCIMSLSLLIMHGCAVKYLHTLTHTLTHSYTHTHSLTHTHTLTHTLPHSHTHTLTHTLPHSHTHTHSHTHRTTSSHTTSR